MNMQRILNVELESDSPTGDQAQVWWLKDEFVRDKGYTKEILDTTPGVLFLYQY